MPSSKHFKQSQPLNNHSRNNIKNIYIHKINSLIKISKDTIGKSQIQALNTTNRKKIKKHLSEAQKNTIRLQKNRMSAKKARQRKKIYVKLLQEQQKKLNQLLYKTKNIQYISNNYVDELENKKKKLMVSQNYNNNHNNNNNIIMMNESISNSNINNIKPTHRKSSQGDIDINIPSINPIIINNNNIKSSFSPYINCTQPLNKVQQKLHLLTQIIQQLKQLSKYAYWKQSKPLTISSQQSISIINQQQNKSINYTNLNLTDTINNPNIISNQYISTSHIHQLQQQDFFNIQQVLADIQVIQMKPTLLSNHHQQQYFNMNLDDLLNVPFEQEDSNIQHINNQDINKGKYDIKTLIGDQYETVSRCLKQLETINGQAQELIKSTLLLENNHKINDVFNINNNNNNYYSKNHHHYHNQSNKQDIKNPQLVQFKKKNTIVPQYQIKKIKPRRIDSLNSLSSANRSIISRTRSLFSLNNFFINMQQAQSKILAIDRAIQEISRVMEKEQDNQNHMNQMNQMNSVEILMKGMKQQDDQDDQDDGKC